MIGIEYLRRLRYVSLMIGNAGVTYYQRVDTQVELTGFFLIIGCQRVEYELIVGCRQRVCFIKVRVRTENLN